MKILGPYQRPDGRFIINIVNDDGRKTSMSYPKYLMEKKLGRKLLPNETVHHKDEDFTNNDYDNLEIKDRSKHSRHHAFHLKSEDFICPTCQSQFTLVGKKLSMLKRNQRRRKSAGPFCNKRCAGKYASVAETGIGA